MPASWIIIGIVSAYLLTCLVLGSWAGRGASDTPEGYVAGDRSFGLVLMYFITGATIFSAYAFLGTPGWAYSRGAAAFYSLSFGTLAFVPIYFLGPRAYRLGRRYGFITQAQMVAHRFDRPSIAGLMALVSIVALVPYLALQMKGAGFILATVTEGAIPEWVGTAVVYSVVLAYVLRSGVLGVGWTNTFQGIFMILLAWVLGLYLPYRLYGGVGPMFQQIAAERPQMLLAPGLDATGQPWLWSEYSSAIVVSMVGGTMWPHIFMKAFAARNEATLRRTAVLLPTFQLFLIPLFLIGFAGVFFASAPPKPDQILPHILMNMDIPAAIVGLFCAGALAASMSSGDAMVHAAASIAVRDGLRLGLGRRIEPAQERGLIRLGVVLVMLGAYLTAVVYQGSLVGLLLSAYGAVVQFAPSVVATLYWRRATGTAVLASMIAGSLLTVVFVLWPQLRPFSVHAGLYGLIANVAVLVAVIYARPRSTSTSEQDQEFLAIAGGRSATAQRSG